MRREKLVRTAADPWILALLFAPRQHEKKADKEVIKPYFEDSRYIKKYQTHQNNKNRPEF